MTINVDTVNLNIQVGDAQFEYLSFCGHFINIEYDDDITLSCTACGQEETVEDVPDEHRWNVICYLLGRYRDSCRHDEEDVEERLQTVLERYIGRPADSGTIAAIEQDMRDVVGDEVRFHFRTP